MPGLGLTRACGVDVAHADGGQQHAPGAFEGGQLSRIVRTVRPQMDPCDPRREQGGMAVVAMVFAADEVLSVQLEQRRGGDTRPHQTSYQSHA